ncbi:MAG: type IV pilus twitching motility protein PilT, partial [Gammaproteobacteria bacterium]
MSIAELLAFSVKNKSSDLHLSSGLPPMIRVDGDLRKINLPPLDSKAVHDLLYEIMTDQQRKTYEEFLEVDFSYEIPNLARFRVNVFHQQRGPAGVLRTIPNKIASFEELGLPEVLKDISNKRNGLVLVTGPTGSGKSTTLATMIDNINRTRYEHIITIEDPIEFIHQSDKCLINQREINRDTLSFNNALRASL